MDSIQRHQDGETYAVIAGEVSVSRECVRYWCGASGLLAGDVVRVVTPQGSTTILEAKTAGKLQTTFKMEAAGFARLEILRSFAPGILPLLPVLLSNPIYFETG
jgi:hypothetical protein